MFCLFVLNRANVCFTIQGLRHTRRGATQVGFRLMVNHTLPNGGTETVWDSGRVSSNRTVGWIYGREGSPSRALTSDADYSWSVEVWWDGEAFPSLPSTSQFSTALLHPDTDLVGTSWIGGLAEDDDRNQFRKEFTLPPGASVVRARCYVAGLGYHTSYLNGERLGTPGGHLGLCCAVGLLTFWCDMSFCRTNPSMLC